MKNQLVHPIIVLLSLAAQAQTPSAEVLAAAQERRQDAEPQQAGINADPAREAFRQRRREAAHRQRRLIFNNDGDDAIMVPKSQPATPESMLNLRTTPLLGSQVDSIYLFNLFDPKRAEWKELGDPKTLEGRDKLYFVTCRNGPPETGYLGWLAGCPALQNRTILTPQDPRQIRRGIPATLDLRVGDDLGDAAWGGKPPILTLHLRVKGLKKADGADVRLNGQRLENGTLTEDRLVYSVPRDLVRRGANRVEVGAWAEALSVTDWTLYDVVFSIKHK